MDPRRDASWLVVAHQLWIMPFMSRQRQRTKVEVIELGYTVLLDHLHDHLLA